MNNTVHLDHGKWIDQAQVFHLKGNGWHPVLNEDGFWFLDFVDYFHFLVHNQVLFKNKSH